MDSDLAVVPSIAPGTQEIVEATLNSVGPGSRPVYTGAILAYLRWAMSAEQSDPYASLVAYRQFLEAQGRQPATINRHLAAVRAFFRTAYNMGRIQEASYRAVREVKNISVQGQKVGNWLDENQITCLLAAPDLETITGRRDRAILALFLGCGLRRSEIANLTWGHLIYREKVWRIENLLGKHNRTRSIPMPSWVYQAIVQYHPNFGGSEERIFVRITRYNFLGSSLSSHALWDIVKKYAAQCGIADLAPHDLRRTYAKVLRDRGGEWEEIQQVLGHSSLTTTQRYVASTLDFERVANLMDRED